MIELQSTRSMRVSLETIRRGEGGLDAHRAYMLSRVPKSGDWVAFPYERHQPLEMKDLAYLTAKTGHEFAILRGKHGDILFHGSADRCTFHGELFDLLSKEHLTIYGHSHPGEEFPVPSRQDRDTLKLLGQTESRIISGLSGIEIRFTADLFES